MNLYRSGPVAWTWPHVRASGVDSRFYLLLMVPVTKHEHITVMESNEVIVQISMRV